MDYITDRLIIDELTPGDSNFIFELLNTDGWIQFIGDRNIKTKEDAAAYIRKIIDNPNVTYWVTRLKDTLIPVGVISFIKRDYLMHHDIGFAFLPEHGGKGYAYEAAKTVLADKLKYGNHLTILAATLEENKSSIQLLNKLGFTFSKEIYIENEKLLVYAISAVA